VEADLAFGSAPALPYSVAAPAMRFAGELLGILAQHLLDRSANDGVVVVMALLFFADSAPRA
jgi:hypothetical protein